MAIHTLKDGTELFYQIDDFSDPWSPAAETVIFLHGLAESGDAWRAWVPHFARRYKVLRPDQRGFGRSSATVENFVWSIDVPVDDLKALTSALGIERFHLVSAKFGGTVAMRFAAKYPNSVKSLSIVSAPPSLKNSLGSKIPGWIEQVKQHGVRDWAESTMAGRLGSQAPASMLTWWTDMMGHSAVSTMNSVLRNLAEIDVTQDLQNIQCPTLVITTTGSALGAVSDIDAWRNLIPNSTLDTIDSDSYHIAASQPDLCANKVFEFIRSVK